MGETQVIEDVVETEIVELTEELLNEVGGGAGNAAIDFKGDHHGVE